MNYSMLALSNNTATRHILSRIRQRFTKIYKQRVFVHHYTQFMDVQGFDEALANCTNVVQTYAEMERLNYEASSSHEVSADYNRTQEETYKYRFKPII